MAGNALNIKTFSPLTLHLGLTGNCHAISATWTNRSLFQNISTSMKKIFLGIFIFYLFSLLFGKERGHKKRDKH